MSSRRKLNPEFKPEAIELAISSGRAVAQVAAEIWVAEGALGSRVRVWREEHPDVDADEPGPVEWEKYKVPQTEMKREIEFFGYPDSESGVFS